MKTLRRVAAGAAVSSFMLGIALLSAGCQSKGPEAGAAANSSAAPPATAAPPKDVPPQVASSIKDAQAAGDAYRNQAMKDGAAAGAASNGWR